MKRRKSTTILESPDPNANRLILEEREFRKEEDNRHNLVLEVIQNPGFHEMRNVLCSFEGDLHTFGNLI